MLDGMWVTRAREDGTRLEGKGWKKGHGRSTAANTVTTKSIAVLCSQPFGTVVTVKWSTFLRLVDIWPRQATVLLTSKNMAVAEWLQSFNRERGPMEKLGIM